MESSRRLKNNDGELRRLQQEFEADFSKPKVALFRDRSIWETNTFCEYHQN